MSKKVVVTGIGLITPLGLDRNSTWKGITTGVNGIKNITSFDTENFQTKIAAEITDFSPEETLGKKFSKRLDRFAQFACVAAQEAIKDAGIFIDSVDVNRFSVLIGSGIGGIITLSEQFDVLRDKGPNRINPFLVPMMLSDMASGQVSMMLGTKGPNFSTVSACASAADSIGQGMRMIQRGDSDIVMAGGTEAAICPIGIAGFNSARALSTNNDNPTGAYWWIVTKAVKKKTKRGAQYLRLRVMGSNGKQEWMNCWGWNGEDQVAPYTVCVGIVSSNHYGKSTKWTKMRIFLG